MSDPAAPVTLWRYQCRDHEWSDIPLPMSKTRYGDGPYKALKAADYDALAARAARVEAVEAVLAELLEAATPEFETEAARRRMYAALVKAREVLSRRSP